MVAIGLAPSVAAFERTETCDSFGTFECEPGEEPKPISWPVRCVKYRINNQGSDDFSGDDTLTPELRSHVRESFDTWQRPECTDLQLVEGQPTFNSETEYLESEGYQGNMNLVVWRDDEWPHRSGRHSFALTSITFDSDSGRIVDADIEINSADSTYTYLEESRVGETSKIDLGNALTHEVGHFIGLDHTSERSATMFPSATAGEIKKRTLAEDDIRGLCEIYPAGDDRTQCQSPSDFRPPGVSSRVESGCGCTRSQPDGPTGTPSIPWVLVIGGGLGLLVLFRDSNS